MKNVEAEINRASYVKLIISACTWQRRPRKSEYLFDGTATNIFRDRLTFLRGEREFREKKAESEKFSRVARIKSQHEEINHKRTKIATWRRSRLFQWGDRRLIASWPNGQSDFEPSDRAHGAKLDNCSVVWFFHCQVLRLVSVTKCEIFFLPSPL